jgi:putative addiction module component (TIGR02574 family)
MSLPSLDLSSLSVDERLQLIEALWHSIEESAASGDPQAARVLDQSADIDPGFVAELEREADEAEKDPSTLVPWEQLLAELRQKRG